MGELKISLVGVDLYQVTFSLDDTSEETLVVYIDCYDKMVYGLDYE